MRTRVPILELHHFKEPGERHLEFPGVLAVGKNERNGIIMEFVFF